MAGALSEMFFFTMGVLWGKEKSLDLRVEEDEWQGGTAGFLGILVRAFHLREERDEISFYAAGSSVCFAQESNSASTRSRDLAAAVS